MEAVILAAGFSSRAGTFKMALDFDGRAMLQRNIEAMYGLCKRMIVVGGYQIEKIQSLTVPYDKVQVIYNEKYEEGMFSSARKGISLVQAERFFFTPGDYPLITEEICRALLEVEGEVVIPSFKGRKGHPILLSKQCAAEIMEEPQDSNLKLYLYKKQCTVIEVENEGILLDVDTIEDYAQTHSRFKSKKDLTDAKEFLREENR